MTDRSRREKQDKLSKLAEYKRAREGGARIWKVRHDVDLYDEVSEEQYKKIVKGRLQRDDFVVDDGVDGYMDNGMDDWMDEAKEESDDEGAKRPKGKKSKAEKPKANAKQRPLPPPVPAPSISAYRPTVSAEQENDFMASLLGAMDSAPIPAPIPKSTRSRKRKPSPDPFESSSPPQYDIPRHRSPAFDDASSDGPLDDGLAEPPSDDFFMSPKKKPRTGVVDIPATEMERLGVQSGSEDLEFDDGGIDDDALMDVDFDMKPPPVKREPQKINIPKPVVQKKSDLDMKGAWLSSYNTLNVVDTSDTLGPLAGTSSSVKPAAVSALEPDGSLRFFWLDYLELDGKIYFTGKLRDKKTGVWVSCCVTVEGIQRNLFVLPRTRRVELGEDGSLIDTDEIPQLTDVYDDFDAIRKELGIKSWKGKFVKRKYAFGDRNIPREETQWLKVVYGFHEKTIPSEAQSPTIASIFGTNTSAFELLVLKRKIMGPCWLTIKNPEIENKGISWCKLEVTVSDPKDINPFPETDHEAPRDTPPLTVMSLSIRTIVNHRENLREVVCTTARTWHNMNIEDATSPDQLPCTVQTFVRPLDSFPPNFETKARSNGRGLITPVLNERALLNSLLVAIHKADPDVIVGHEFLGVSLDVLLSRMRDLKADHWSRISRFRRAKWPMIGKQGSNLKFLNGRMLCDLASDGAKTMIASTTWSLTEMCKTHLDCDRPEIDADDTSGYFDGSVSSPDRLLTFVRHCEMDAHFQMAIAAKVQILPLTKQLTSLAGNSWNKTLNGGRAERNEYILLHEFHRLKYVCPDKSWAWTKKAVSTENDEQEGTKKGRRDKYKGGLVFEPKRGLWDKYILVMDFNSLYPSIIQEYNIDFTTIEPNDETEEGAEDKIPEPPASTVAVGVLPRLIAHLVNRRRQTKSLMKDKSASRAKLLQWDIKQQALKLTANSMYGCLGFEYSRFYAKPLAALVTFKGREILTHTRELAESLELDVVYGDTDSVFVNTNATDLAEAMKISADFKKAVNDRYKLLEIDLDGVFQRLLLLQKKKYAALKVGEGGRTSTEVKGLDMKRREYCALSKNVSQYVLEQILSGAPTDQVVENIHEYLTTIAQNVRQGKTNLDEFIIFKRLGKRPQDYPDAKSQPHVQVALRMKAKGGSARAGDVISYIFCVAEGENAANVTLAERAKHPDEIRRSGNTLQIDHDYYLAHQILPPVERLCDPIEGTDRARLAECLGLDPARYRNTVGGSEERAFLALDSRMSDQERFKDAVPFLIRCSQCDGELPFAPLTDRASSILKTNAPPQCPACQAPISEPSLQVQLEMQIRGFISKYYQGWVVCDDPTCGNRTRMMRVYGRRCLRPGCKGTVAFEYPDSDLYMQLRYFASLFDEQKIRKAAIGSSDKVATEAAVNYNTLLLEGLLACTNKHLDQSGRRWVSLPGLFSFMKS
ncbi:hypothetical protein BDN72DRAFT_948057 [Pluteus cervinus]|uniref:Uncharacterized protein n=1 Tax=Pluteus cervinus TaxID=181527 RepID=A0ACD3ASD5_9AGAR|nr:hypothetical protein BDN72DRAFT_948057 [Pluteus cervinus]